MHTGMARLSLSLSLARLKCQLATSCNCPYEEVGYCVMTGMETPNALTSNIDVEPMFGVVLLVATQASPRSHRTGAYTDK
jgi:hypothetical protein